MKAKTILLALFLGATVVLYSQSDTLVLENFLTEPTGYSMADFSDLSQFRIYDDTTNTSDIEVLLKIFHGKHEWEYVLREDILNEPFEEWSRTCSICTFTESFIVRKIN